MAKSELANRVGTHFHSFFFDMLSAENKLVDCFDRMTHYAPVKKGTRENMPLPTVIQNVSLYLLSVDFAIFQIFECEMTMKRADTRVPSIHLMKRTARSQPTVVPSGCSLSPVHLETMDPRRSGRVYAQHPGTKLPRWSYVMGASSSVQKAASWEQA